MSILLSCLIYIQPTPKVDSGVLLIFITGSTMTSVMYGFPSKTLLLQQAEMIDM